MGVSCSHLLGLWKCCGDEQICFLGAQDEITCKGDDGSTFCSTLGFCIEFTDTAESDPTATRTFPEIKILGTSVVLVLDAGSVYARCSEDDLELEDGPPCDP